jgi:hypothetical protein
MNNAQTSAAAFTNLVGGDFQLNDLDCLSCVRLAGSGYALR